MGFSNYICSYATVNYGHIVVLNICIYIVWTHLSRSMSRALWGSLGSLSSSSLGKAFWSYERVKINNAEKITSKSINIHNALNVKRSAETLTFIHSRIHQTAVMCSLTSDRFISACLQCLFGGVQAITIITAMPLCGLHRSVVPPASPR